MNQKSTIDSLFKNGLQGLEPAGADDGWQRLEQPLQQQNQAQDRRRKRRAAAWLLGMLALLGGGALLWMASNGNTDADGTAQANTKAPQAPVANNRGTEQPASTAPAPIDRPTTKELGDGTAATNGNHTSVQQGGRANFRINGGETTVEDGNNSNTVRKPVRRIHQKGRQHLTVKPAEVGTEAIETATADEAPVAAATTTEATTEPINPTTAEPPTQQQPTVSTTVNEAATAKNKPTAPTATDSTAQKESATANEEPPTPQEPLASKAARQKKQAKSPLQLELAAGIDISTGLGNPGKYAALMVRLPLNKKASLLVGTGIATNKLTTGYTQADKQNLLNSPIDATLRGLTMLQFPLLYEQPIKEQKLLLRAGLMPIYILDAAIVNVPNGFSGNPLNFRTFTLQDIHRFNVLFSAGLHYRFTPRLGIELRANYGLTELVKNSYINQSGENNNLKSAQVGMLFMLGRQRK
jgi:hypothetical protein